VGVESSGFEAVFVVEENSDIGGVGYGEDLALISRLIPAGLIVVLRTYTHRLVPVTLDKVIKRHECIAGSPVADGKAVLVYDIRRLLAYNGGHKLLRVHLARPHAEDADLNTGVAFLELPDHSPLS